MCDIGTSLFGRNINCEVPFLFTHSDQTKSEAGYYQQNQGREGT